MIQEPNMEKWCEHINLSESNKKSMCYFFEFKDASNYKFCPICGTPRPTPKSKREELADKFYQLLIESHMKYDSASNWRMCVSRECADIAIKMIEEHNAK